MGQHTIAELLLMIERLVSDAESEKETRKRRNDSFDRQIKDLNDRVNNLKEREMMLSGKLVAAALLWGFVVALIVFLATKK